MWDFIIILDPCLSGYTYNATTDSCEPCGYHRYRDRDLHNLCQDCEVALFTDTDTAESADQCLCKLITENTYCIR